MDVYERQAVAAELYQALYGRVQEMFVLSRLFGQPVDQTQLVERMEADLRDSIGRIGTYPSVYSDFELAERKAIATAVVQRLRKEFAVG